MSAYNCMSSPLLWLMIEHSCCSSFKPRVFVSPASLVASPQSGQKRRLLSKRHLTPMPSPLDCKRYTHETLQSSASTCTIHYCFYSSFLSPSLLFFLRPCTRVRPESPEELLRSLLPHSCPVSAQVEVHRDQALLAGLDLVRRTDFDPTHSLSVR